MPLPPTPVPWLQVMTDRIVEQFDPLKIILFGSHARGEATADSDIDLLVVFPELKHKRETTIAIRSILADLPVAKDIVVTTPAEIAEYGDLVGPILRPALREGKVIYERASRDGVHREDPPQPPLVRGVSGKSTTDRI